LRFRRPTRRAVTEASRRGDRLYVWASHEPAWLAGAAAEAGLTLTRIEDGFLRSAGLGSNFAPPLSLVFDDAGIYFDPARESGLERFLNDPDFPPPALRAEARRLRVFLAENGLTKYNVGNMAKSPSPLKEGGEINTAICGSRTILVPGQVKDDASIRRGAPKIKRNLDLLAAVREAAPDATILYKPHPEIEAGNRRGAVPERDARRYADRILTGWNAASALALVDEVHTMTSLMGFEALLRGIPVTTYGLPFYAGLGLTTDQLAWPRPRRRVDLDTLVAASLLAYPRYHDPDTTYPTDAFATATWLAQRRAPAPVKEIVARRAGRWLRLAFGA
jgi:capsular polysaccharide export protein